MASLDSVSIAILLGAVLVMAGILSSLLALRFGAGPLVVAFVVAQRRVERGERRLGQRRAEHRLAAQRANARLLEQRAIGGALRGDVPAMDRLAECLLHVAVGARELARGGHEPDSQLLVELGKARHLGANLLEELHGGAHPRFQIV